MLFLVRKNSESAIGECLSQQFHLLGMLESKSLSERLKAVLDALLTSQVTSNFLGQVCIWIF